MNNPIKIDGYYLIIAPRGEQHGYGYFHLLSEPDFLKENIENMFKNYPTVKREEITVYKLQEEIIIN